MPEDDSELQGREKSRKIEIDVEEFEQRVMKAAQEKAQQLFAQQMALQQKAVAPSFHVGVPSQRPAMQGQVATGTPLRSHNITPNATANDIPSITAGLQTPHLPDMNAHLTNLPSLFTTTNNPPRATAPSSYAYAPPLQSNIFNNAQYPNAPALRAMPAMPAYAYRYGSAAPTSVLAAARAAANSARDRVANVALQQEQTRRMMDAAQYAADTSSLLAQLEMQCQYNYGPFM